MIRVTKLIVIAVLFCPMGVRADDWPDWRGPTRDGRWHETGIIDKFESAELKASWRVPISSGYSGPTVADGRVYVTDRVIREADPMQVERIHCFDASTGKNLWTHTYACPYRDVSYDAGPRASVIIDEGLAYALGTMGHFKCLDARSGEIRWERDLNEEYKIRMPIWGIAAAPIIEDDLIIVQIGGEGACLVAFDKKTGQEKWKALDDAPSYSAPIIIDQAGKRVLVCYTGERVVGVSPATGELYWAEPFPARRMVIGIASPVLWRDYLFISNFFDGCMLLKLDRDELKVAKVWQRAGEDEKNTDGLHSIISTPYIKDGYIYGVDSYGELRCLDLKTGERVWESDKAVPRARWATIHFVEHAKHMWLFNERGELIIADLSPQGYKEISRAKLLDPTKEQLRERDGVCWSHPAFARKHIFQRNDKELVSASLAKE